MIAHTDTQNKATSSSLSFQGRAGSSCSLLYSPTSCCGVVRKRSWDPGPPLPKKPTLTSLLSHQTPGPVPTADSVLYSRHARWAGTQECPGQQGIETVPSFTRSWTSRSKGRETQKRRFSTMCPYVTQCEVFDKICPHFIHCNMILICRSRRMHEVWWKRRALGGGHRERVHKNNTV